MQDLRVATLRALSYVGGSFLEVSATIVLRHTRRFSDYANQLDPMLDLDEASLRLHHAEGAQMWEQVEGISLNRDQILLLIPYEELAWVGHPELRSAGRDVRIKLFCSGVQITGFIRIPLQATTSSFLHQTAARFMAVTQARLIPTAGQLWLDGGELTPPFCLVNRHLITACIETRSMALPEGGLEDEML